MTQTQHRVQVHSRKRNARETLSVLSELSQTLLKIADQESESLQRRDAQSFAALQHSKKSIANEYMSASQEFQNNLQDFKDADLQALNALDQLQGALHKKTSANNELIKAMRTQATATTGSTLFLTQALGQTAQEQTINSLYPEYKERGRA